MMQKSNHQCWHLEAGQCIKHVRAATSLQRRLGQTLTRKDATRLKANAAGYSGDSEADMLPGIPESAGCVQGSIDSRNSAIHSAYRISLRPSSLFEPRHPSLKVVMLNVVPGGTDNKRITG